MAASTTQGRAAFDKVFTAAHIKVSKKAGRTVEKVLDPATLTMIFGFLTSALKICFNRDGEQATIQRLKSRGGLNATETYRALLRGGYASDESRKTRREQCREMAAELTAQTGKVSAEDLEAFLDDVRETPTPTPADVGDDFGGGFWSILLAFALIFSCSNLIAAEPASGFWDMETDVKETRRMVTTLGSDVSSLKSRLTAIEAETRSNTTTLNLIANAVLPPEASPVCVPAPEPPAEAKRIELAPPANAIQQESLQVELASVSAKLNRLTAELNSLQAGKVRSAGASVTIPANTRRAKIRFRGRDVNDVDAFLAANPCNEVGMARGYEGMIDMHLRQHGYDGDFSGMSYAKKIRLHSVAHKGNVRWPSGVSATAYVTAERTVAAPASNCANGQCNRAYTASATVSSRQRGGGIFSFIFGRR